MKLRAYISTFGPQFVIGLGILAGNAKGDPVLFRRSLSPLPNFSKIKSTVEPSQVTVQIRRVVWISIAIAWVSLAAILLFAHLPLIVWGALAIFVSFIAPFVLILVAWVWLSLKSR